MKIKINEHIDLLGHKVVDKVTGFKGVVTTVGFDLYGCIQTIVTPEADEKGKAEGGQWFDIARLKKISTTPVMDRPAFEYSGDVADGKKGGSSKPLMRL